MYIDLLPITRRYRGMDRGLGEAKLLNTKKWGEYFKKYEKYLEWLSEQDNSFNPEVLQMLIELRDEIISRGAPCEIIYYSDKPEEFHLGEGFLGFDVYWVEEGSSGISDSELVDVYCGKELNDYGLFATYEDALEFSVAWKKDIDLNDPSDWVLETNPRPFCIWLNKNS